MFAKALVNQNRALSLTVNKLGGQSPRLRPIVPYTIFSRIFYYNSLYPNGIIRYKSKSISISKFEFCPKILLAVGVTLGFTGTRMLFNNTNYFSKAIRAGTWNNYIRHKELYGIVPDLNDHSYGSWNYYPFQ